MDKIKLEVNRLGKKPSKGEKFIFVSTNIERRSNHSRRMVTIENTASGKKATCIYQDLRQGKNPFHTKKMDDQFIKDQINKIGKKGKNSDEHFEFHKILKKTAYRHRFIEVKNISSGKKKSIRLTQILNGTNPFRNEKFCHEVNVVQPQINKALKKLGFKVKKEVYLSKKSRIDFLCTNKQGKKIIIEVKSDIKRHDSKNLTEQISRYKTEGKKKFGKEYAGTFLVSLKGRYGYSIKELPLVLKAKGLV